MGPGLFTLFLEEGLCGDIALITALLAVASKRIADKLWLETMKGSEPLGFALAPGLCYAVINDLEKQ